MTSLWFVQPVHGRVGLSRLCMEQRRRMVDELAGLGIDAQVVVVGNDANLGTARELGFHVLERPNVLGSKVNDGFEWACRERGADFVSYIGSDDWALASWYVEPPPPGLIKTSRHVGFVSPDGTRLTVHEARWGNAPWMIPRDILVPTEFRPVPDTRTAGIDNAIRRTLGERWHYGDGDIMRLVDFKGSAEQLTAYSIAVSRTPRVLLESPAPWEALATRYPVDLVERMQKFYAEGMPQ
jgi:hypothetical protein